MNMGRRLSGILLLVAASWTGWAVAQPRSADLEATSLIRQAESLRTNKLSSSIDNRSDLARRERVFAAAQALEASIDAGSVSLSGDLRNRLSVSLEALQDVPVDVSLLSTRAPLANGTLSGTVSDATTGLPVTIANAVRVQAWDFSSQASPTGAGIVNSAFINASGQYTLTLPPGNYHVRTTSNTQGFINQAFGFGNCPDNFYCPRYVGTIVTVPDGGAVNNINFQMQPGGRITGTVTRSDTSAPLVSSSVSVVNENGQFATGAGTDAAGVYTTGGLVPGRYRVYASPPGSLPGFLGEVHNNIPCSVNDCFGFMPVDWITVTGTGTTTGINFSLDPLAGSISGTVTESGTGLPIQDDGSFTFLVNLRSEDQNTFMSVELGAGGTYSFTGLRPGNYIVSASVPGFIGKIVSSLAPVATSDCVSDACDHLTQGARISVAPSGNVTGLDFQLDRGARVSGTIRSVSGALPIQGATVSLSGPAFASGVTDALGNFTVSGIPAGVYYVNADAPALNYVQTWLGDVPCRGFHCQGTGTPLTVTANAVISGLQINLGTGGTLSGTISDGLTGFPAPRQTRLELFDTSNRLIVQSISNGAGGFSFGGLAPGAYKAVFASSSVVGWMDTAFGGLQCPRGGCDQSLLPSVFVTAGATTSGINVTLPRGPRISGRILDATTGQPIVPKAWGSTYSSSVAMNNNLSNYAGFASVDRAGNYLSRTGFPNGPYFVSTFLLRNNTPIGGGYIDELFDDRACPYGSCGLTSGTPVNVAGTDVTGINMNLSPGGGMSGRVTDAGSGNGLAGVTVRAFDATNRLVAVSATGPTGNYQISGLPAGNYFLTTDNPLGYQDELFNGFSCEPFCNPSTGSAVVVTGTTITANRDFALERSVTISGLVTEGVPLPTCRSKSTDKSATSCERR
ncbi:MAG: carboxypeptidase regulatory-like domain-containing protein [Ahniella sp.]|nr:carboxypeptidase regulatory-like domain-containing protein [Ahniella sp.]